MEKNQNKDLHRLHRKIAKLRTEARKQGMTAEEYYRKAVRAMKVTLPILAIIVLASCETVTGPDYERQQRPVERKA